jgi:hypothetical protein
MSLFRRRHVRYRKPRTPLMWMAVILILVGILAAIMGLGGGAINFIEKYFGYRDDSYRPMDTERQTIDILQEQSKSTNQSRP